MSSALEQFGGELASYLAANRESMRDLFDLAKVQAKQIDLIQEELFNLIDRVDMLETHIKRLHTIVDNMRGTNVFT
jgi:hypothetical protein